MREEGKFYYLTENTERKKFHGSLEPPLGSTGRKTDSDAFSEHSNGRSLVAQISTESCTTGGPAAGDDGRPHQEDLAVVQPVEGVDQPEACEPPSSAMVDSSVTLIASVDGDVDASPDDVHLQLDSPSKKSNKKRFESGTTSNPGENPSIKEKYS